MSFTFFDFLRSLLYVARLEVQKLYRAVESRNALQYWLSETCTRKVTWKNLDMNLKLFYSFQDLWHCCFLRCFIISRSGILQEPCDCMEVTGTFCTFVSGVWWRDFEKQNNKTIKTNKWDNRINRGKSEQSSGSDGLMFRGASEWNLITSTSVYIHKLQKKRHAEK